MSFDITFDFEHPLDAKRRLGVGVAVVGAVATVAGSAIAGSMQASAAKSAAQTEANATMSAANLQNQATQQAVQRLAPYNIIGQNAAASLASATGVSPQGLPSDLTQPSAATLPPGVTPGSLATPFQPTMAQLAATPGYQFTLQQGLQGTQNLYAAGGLGRSGAALKGAANYSEGLAATTYQQQFQNYLAQNQQIYNMLQGQVQTGEAAGAGQATAGITGTQGVAQSTTQAGQAQAAGTIGAANATANALTNSGSAVTQAALLYGLSRSLSTGAAGGGGGGAP